MISVACVCIWKAQKKRGRRNVVVHVVQRTEKMIFCLLVCFNNVIMLVALHKCNAPV